MKKIICLILSFALTIGASAALAGCGNKNTIIMYTNAEFAPYEFIEGGKVVGVDVEIAKKIAEKAGKKLVIENIDFDALMPKLSQLKDNEMILAGMTITPAREERALFSNPYANSIQYIIYKEASGLDTIEKLSGKKVGVQTATTGHYLLTDNLGDDENEFVLSDVLNIDVQPRSSAQIAALELNQGELDAVIVDKLPAEMITGNIAGLKAVAANYELEGDNIFAEESYGVAVKTGNTELMDIINEVIAELIADKSIENWTNEFSGTLTN